jgi:hypothetical protein
MPFKHKIIRAYRNEIMMLQIRNNDEILIQLPQTNKELFKRIVAGGGKYEDSELINK